VTLAGQAVGVKEVDDGIWLVSFMDYDLGYVDLEERTLSPIHYAASESAVKQRMQRVVFGSPGTHQEQPISSQPLRY
jgi:hypothetical protein